MGGYNLHRVALPSWAATKVALPSWAAIRASRTTARLDELELNKLSFNDLLLKRCCRPFLKSLNASLQIFYCEKTCESFSCADGYTSKTEAAFFRAPSKDKCCEPSCKLLTRPGGFLKKPSLTKTDRQTACLKARGWKSQCKNGFLLRKDAGSVIAGSAQLAPERCCNPTCTGFSWPLGKQLIADAEKTFGTCESTCCEPTPCTSLACPPV